MLGKGAELESHGKLYVHRGQWESDHHPADTDIRAGYSRRQGPERRLHPKTRSRENAQARLWSFPCCLNKIIHPITHPITHPVWSSSNNNRQPRLPTPIRSLRHFRIRRLSIIRRRNCRGPSKSQIWQIPQPWSRCWSRSRRRCRYSGHSWPNIW